MSELKNAEVVPARGIGSLKWNDLLKGLYYAIIGQVLYLIGFFFSSLLQEHPHLPTWAEWLPYLKPVVIQIGGYIVGKLGVNNVGQILTGDKSVVHVDAEEYNDLKAKAAE